MSSHVIENYSPQVLGVNATALVAATNVGGFLAITSGTLTLTRASGTVIVNALPVTAGVYHPIPFHFGTNGGTVSLAGGASGTLGVS